LESIKPYLGRAGVTRIADVTGLDNIGVPTTLAIRPNALTIACSSGKGLTLDQAYVSGAMEAFELHAAETVSLPSIRASYRELAHRYDLPTPTNLPLTRWSLFDEDWPFQWFLGWNLINQCEAPIPLAMVGMSRSSALMSSMGAFQVSSNGLGAGNSFLEAVTSGLYECIERDAIACQYHAALHRGFRMPVVQDDVLKSYPLVASVIQRCERAEVNVVVYDCTIDTTVPAYSALVYNRIDNGVGVVRGSGAHLDPEIAVLRAVTEALQARLNFIAGSRDDIFRAAFARTRAEWGWAVSAIENDLIDAPPALKREARTSTTFEHDIALLLSCVERTGLKSVVVADITPSDFPVYIVRVVIPGFEGYMHHGYRPGRRALDHCLAEPET
jgi:ribosomal protein S12 methylthiotransferase accessory factor